MSTRLQQLSNKEIYISCVIPAYNEQANIAAFIQQLYQQLQQLTNHFEIIIVDDGSKDDTVEIIKHLALPSLKLIVFSRNFGKEIALTAGLEHSSGDVVILIDADFQHPIAVIPFFLKYWADDYDMVYGIRDSRQNESLLKKTFANLFYKLMAKITRVNIPANAGDFRLLDKKIVETLKKFPERSRFMKGLYAWVGFKQIGIPFTVHDRAAGKSSWRFTRLTELAITGITSFSHIPLRVWGVIGLGISTFAFIYATFIILQTLILGVQIPGFASIVVAIMFLGGIQLLSIGILGEYIGQIFNEVKKRPIYIIDQRYGFDE